MPFELGDEPGHLDSTFDGEALLMESNAFYFMEGFRSKVTFSAMRAHHERDVFDDE